jgi:hypothetical protein
MFHKPVDEHNIKDSDLTEFGIVLLEQFQQEPLLRKLRETVIAAKRPVVVDAVRDLADFDILHGLERQNILWFVDATEAAIQSRLAQRAKQAGRSPIVGSRIDQNMGMLKKSAQRTLRNDASLEDLRWRVDDALFEVVHLQRK